MLRKPKIRAGLMGLFVRTDVSFTLLLQRTITPECKACFLPNTQSRARESLARDWVFSHNLLVMLSVRKPILSYRLLQNHQIYVQVICITPTLDRSATFKSCDGLIFFYQKYWLRFLLFYSLVKNLFHHKQGFMKGWIFLILPFQ